MLNKLLTLILPDLQILSEASKGRYSKDTAITFRDAARTSIGSNMPAKSLELKHTIKLIKELDSEIDEIENEIKIIMDELILQFSVFQVSTIAWVQ